MTNSKTALHHKSLMFELSISVIVVTALVLLAMGQYSYSSEKKSWEHELQSESAWTVKNLATGLALPIYNYADLTINSLCMTAMNQSHMARISLDLGHGTLLHFVKESDGNIKKTASPSRPKNCISASTSITHGKKNIAELTIYMSRDALEEKLNASIRLKIITFFILEFTLVLFLIILLRQRLVRPIRHLATTAVRISRGELETAIDIPKTAELANLARSFDKMRNDIQQQMVALQNEVASRKKSEAELTEYKTHLEELVVQRTTQLEKSQNELIDYAHQAGKAEIATGVLHNIGNVLTSLVVAADMLRNSLTSRLPEKLGSATRLIDKNRDTIGTFFENDTQGQNLLTLIENLPEALANNRRMHTEHLDKIFTSLELIKESVAAQQAYALQNEFEIEFLLENEIERALLLEKPSLQKYHIDTPVTYETKPKLRANKSKLINAMVNIIRNAKDALQKNPVDARTIHIDVKLRANGAIAVAICDNGCGIEKGNIDKIFSYGFTTKADGHGFGLHHSINDIKSMGGAIEITSDGIGKGCCFTIIIPAKRIIHA